MDRRWESIVRGLCCPTKGDYGVIERSENFAENHHSVGEEEEVAIGMGIIPSEVDARLTGAYVFNIGVELGGSSRHCEWVGFDATHSSIGQEGV